MCIIVFNKLMRYYLMNLMKYNGGGDFMSINIMQLNKSHITQSAEIIRQSFETVADEFCLTKENAPTNAAFLQDDKLLEDLSSGITMFGLFKDSVQVGFMELKQKDTNTFYLEKLAVMPSCRHKGCGKLLLTYAKDYVKSLQGSNISIGIIYENKILLQWYEAYGFIITGTKQFSHLPFTVCFMSLDI